MQKKLVAVHNSKLTSLKMTCPCHKKNADSFQTQQECKHFEHVHFGGCIHTNSQLQIGSVFGATAGKQK